MLVRLIEAGKIFARLAGLSNPKPVETGKTENGELKMPARQSLGDGGEN